MNQHDYEAAKAEGRGQMVVAIWACCVIAFVLITIRAFITGDGF